MPLEKNTYRSIKIQSNTSINVEEYIKNCIDEYKETESGNGLFNTDGKYFWSESLLKRMTKMEEVSAKRKQAGQRGARGRWGKKEEEIEAKKKKKIKLCTSKNDKTIANAINKYGKCYKYYGKCIAKNSKIKSKSKSKHKYKYTINSIYPSNHKYKENEMLNSMMDEIDRNEFDTIVTQSKVTTYNDNGKLASEIIDIMKEIYMNPETREKILNIDISNIDYAIRNFAIANTKSNIQKPKAYFKKCLLSALEQTELSKQYDVNTIYENME